MRVNWLCLGCVVLFYCGIVLRGFDCCLIVFVYCLIVLWFGVNMFEWLECCTCLICCSSCFVCLLAIGCLFPSLMILLVSVRSLLFTFLVYFVVYGMF